MRYIGCPDGATLDESAIRELCLEHTPALFRYVLGLTARDQYLAEDIVQETLLRAWQNGETLAARRGAVRPWLFTVARNIVVDRHRARRARPMEVGNESLAASSPVPDDLDAALTSWTVQEAIRTLSRQHRAVIISLYFRGHSVAETATVLGIPLGTVKSRTYYAMRALRLALEERGLAPHVAPTTAGGEAQTATRRRKGATGPR
jgi:RNA polymerase sigma-70 factor (ECF subfamily)